MDPRARVTNRRPLLILGLALGLFLLLLATPVARAGDLDSLAGTGQQQPQGQWHDPELTSDERAAQSVQQQAAAALASVEPTNLNPLLGSLLLPQWRDDKRPDLQFGQGQLFLKNQDATRTLCNVTFTIRCVGAAVGVVVGCPVGKSVARLFCRVRACPLRTRTDPSSPPDTNNKQHQLRPGAHDGRREQHVGDWSLRHRHAPGHALAPGQVPPLDGKVSACAWLCGRCAGRCSVLFLLLCCYQHECHD